MAATISSSDAKVEIHRTISSLKLDDLSAAWELLKSGLETKIGKEKYMCVPYITEEGLFDVSTVFIKIAQSGRAGFRNRTYKPLGKIENLLNRESSFEVWHDISDRVPEPTPFDLHTPFEVIVRDDVNRICVSTIFRELTNQTLPSEFVARRSVVLNESLAPGIDAAKKIYMIDEVILSKSIEIRINIGEEARVFIRDMQQPVAFHFKKYKLNDEKMILRAVKTKVNPMRVTWHRSPGQTDQEAGFVTSTTCASSLFAINGLQSEKSSLDDNEIADEASVASGSFNKNVNVTDDVMPISVN